MLVGQPLLRPAAAEVRSMLHKIKMDNMERGRNIVMAQHYAPNVNKDNDDNGKNKFKSFNFLNHAAKGETLRPWLKTSWSSASSSASLSLKAQAVRQVESSATSTAVEEMGSFTSMPKVIPSPDANDTDLTYPEKEDLKTCLKRCSDNLGTLPPPIERAWRQVAADAAGAADSAGAADAEGESIRIMQWNVLSQALGTKNDNFVRCPPLALNWRTRRFRMLEEVVRHDADIVCLQEVDHFRFLSKSLSALGYDGHFFPKPDSPCLYLPENSGPDGCAIFYKRDKFDLVQQEQRVIEVWHVESNQVALLTTLRSRQTNEELCVATTHLKARDGALLSTLRNEQGKYLVDFLEQQAAEPKQQQQQQRQRRQRRRRRPVVCTGDFNAEPTEPVYQTMTADTEKDLRLRSAYASPSSSGRPKEAEYTTWKIREDGEHIQTLDYIFHSEDRLRTERVLDFPSGEEIGQARLPGLAYASDHFSLVADFRLLPESEPAPEPESEESEDEA